MIPIILKKYINDYKVLIFLITLFTLSGCSKQEENIHLSAAGATFPQPLYDAMFKKYSDNNEMTAITYNGIGSGNGVKQLMLKTVDFAGTDEFLSEKKMEEVEEEILHIPTCIGAVTTPYNLPIKNQLKLSSEIIVKIYLGEITKWSDPLIVAENPETTLPDIDITVVYRADSSGTTFIFTDYLSKSNKDWKNKIGASKILELPIGIKGKGNQGVTNIIKQLEGAIGYIEVSYAKKAKLQYAKIKNKTGNYIAPELENISLAADGNIPDDTRLTITDTDAPYGYPISSFSWIVLYKEQDYLGRRKAIVEETVNLLWWIIHDGQDNNHMLNYGRLPQKVVEKSEAIIKSIQYKGKEIL
jgi:phosphate transport system substrate-binding protein